MTDNSAALQRARRREGQTKRRQALAALQAMTEAGEAIARQLVVAIEQTSRRRDARIVASIVRFQTIVGMPARIALAAIPRPIAPMPLGGHGLHPAADIDQGLGEQDLTVVTRVLEQQGGTP